MNDLATTLSNILSTLLGVIAYTLLIGFAVYAIGSAVILLIDGTMCLLGVGRWKQRARKARHLKTLARIERLETELGMHHTKEGNTHVESHR